MSSALWRFLVLLAVIAVVYLAGNGRTQLFDRDEPRYAQCSRQMLQSGDWVVPRLYDNIRAAKPPAIYWCQAAAMEIFGDNAFAARFPSAIATLLVAILVGICIWRTISPRHALWTVFILASSLLMLWSGKTALTDAVLLICTTAGLLCIYTLWRRTGGWLAVILLAISIACGGLVKGPFILGVLIATPIALAVLRALDRWLERRAIQAPSRRGLRRAQSGNDNDAPIEGTSPDAFDAKAAPESRAPHLLLAFLQCLAGITIVIAIVGPWLYLIHCRAPEFLPSAQADALHHLETGSEGHSGWPGTHFVLIWFTYLPWSLFLPLAIVLAFKHRKVPHIRFALAAVLGTWIFVEIVQTKLPHYILPAFPALTFLTADALIRCLNGEQRDLEPKPVTIGAIVIALVIVGLIVPLWWLSARYHDLHYDTLIPLSAFALVAGTLFCILFARHRPAAALIGMGGASLGIALLLFVVFLPNSQPLRLPIRVADVLTSHGVTHRHEAVMFEYKEPSLAFYQGGTIREYNASLAQLASSPGEPPWAVIPKWVWDQAAPPVRSAFDVIAPSIVGCDYSDAGKRAEVMVIRRKNDHSTDTK